MILSIHREPGSCDHESARLLPWLVAGALSDRENERVQKHIGECAICSADWQREQQLQALICDEPTVEHAPQPGLQNLMSRIDEMERELPVLSGTQDVPEHRARRRFGSVQWLAAATIVQAVGLGILGFLFWQRGFELRAPRFHTLTSPAPVLEGEVRIRVVFAPSMTVSGIRALLKSIPATVVSGPSEAGVFTLAPTARGSDLDQVLDGLCGNADVLFAEPQSRTQGPE